MADVEVRRVQRVGSSSLVVTLPKEWARRLGLEQGSTVLLYDEGGSIRIVPAGNRGAVGVSIDLSRMPPIFSMSIPVCTYLSGMDRVEFTVPNGTPIEQVKMRALYFMGMHVYEAAPNRLVVETLLDMEKIDPDVFIKTLGSIVNRLVRDLADALSDGDNAEHLRSADFARHDFMRTLYVVLRSLFSQAPTRYGRKNTVFKLMSASYVSLAIEIIYTMLPHIAETSELPAKDKELVKEGLEALGKATSKLLRVIPSPSVKRLAELLHELNQTEENITRSIREASTPTTGALLAKMQDSLRIITLASYITICRIINSLAESGTMEK